MKDLNQSNDLMVLESKEYTQRSSEPVYNQVARMVATISDRNVTELEPLANHIDPDSLDKIVDAKSSVNVWFDFEGFKVHVSSNGRIDILSQPDDSIN
mgnify:CR=1 FL=1